MKTDEAGDRAEIWPSQRVYLALIERELHMPKPRQIDVAVAYAQAINMVKPDALPFWRVANAAITKQWPKGLERVKRLAWRYFTGTPPTTGRRG